MAMIGLTQASNVTDSRGVSAFWLFWLFVCVFLDQGLGAGMYLSQLMLALMVARRFLFRIFSVNALMLAIAASSFIGLLLPLQIALAGQASEQIVSGCAKLLFLIWGIFALHDLTEREYRTVLRALPVFVASLVAYVYLAGVWDYYDLVRHRFGVPSMGSPNSLAFVAAFCLLMLHAGFRQDLSSWYRALAWAAWVVLLIALIATQSRGGLLIYALGYLVFIQKIRFRSMVYAVLIVLAFVFLLGPLLSSVVQTSLARFDFFHGGVMAQSTGRFDIWGILIGQLVDSPLALLVGFGPGSIEFERYGVSVNSAHSFVVTMVYWYGLLGVVLLVLGFSHLLLFREGPQLQRAFALMLVVGAALDSYLLGAQLLWFNSLVVVVAYGVASSAPRRLLLAQDGLR